MALAEVRSLGAARRLRTAAEFEDFEQELVDQFALAQVGAGVTDGVVGSYRSVVFEFVRFTGRPVWTTRAEDVDRFLADQRRRGRAASTVYSKAGTLTAFFEFLVARYQGDIHALTGHVLEQPVDEFNRPSKPDYVAVRVPPGQQEVEVLFGAWREALPHARKFLPAARDYMAASLWRRAGLRITESLMLDIRDWRPDLGERGKLHVRFGKGSRGRGHKPRLVPAIEEVDALMEWWLTDVRHQFGPDWSDPDAPLLPSERRDRDTGRCVRIGDDALRSSLADAVDRWLPVWVGRLTPHGLRHFCASSLYERGMDLKAIQEILGHEWLSTTTRYIHVHANHIEHAWETANQRVASRLMQ
ncbi:MULTISPECIES: tyrosine-type recombinase/integrase [Pseudonocardiaceae]|uniref:Integrase n=2 Tax=Pseudonocardiaceae TaxID=2070 RepID=A0A2V4AEF7_9PSEU|nr:MULTISPECIES: tyrosine-type recombinase/integrase [Pseudonocardiaceae]OLZ45616.1 integrase [Amycolatopsis keratiniphila subsp. nogabecina]MBE1579496.1 site-specific recombinase XerD [Amycolatopsis roodepoortensis]PXY17852.1 integrase [Prauserella muralis]TWE14950.1 site-specific recombinase XerD [Prauserella muralis]SDU63044.1 Site-specific recombinase XerD [Amycolatopsis keratiniphila]